jgi:hypothetical protein
MPQCERLVSTTRFSCARVRKEDVMFRGISVALGVGLIILWIVGMSSHAVPWLTWLDGLGGLMGIVMGISVLQVGRTGVAAWGLLALGLYVLWIVGLASGRGMWLAWWTFGFACAFLILAAASASGIERLHHRTA